MDPSILVVGASGFIGSHLVEEFGRQEVPVKAMSRHPERLSGLSPFVVPVYGDLDDPQSLATALDGVTTIYYLVHSLGEDSETFVAREKQHAANLAQLLGEDHRVIYLGGLAPQDKDMSAHMQGRRGVGEILRQSPGRTIEFQASIVVGRGSTSFELIRALIHRLPFIVEPSWAQALSQPIAIKDVVDYLVAAKDKKFRKKRPIFEIGGPDILPYSELLSQYAQEAGLLRPKLVLKQLPKSLAKEVIQIVAPEYSEVGLKLLDSIELSSTANNEEALRLFNIQPMSYREAIRLAKDPDLKKMDVSKILSKLKAVPELPQRLAGQSLQRRFEAPVDLKSFRSAYKKDELFLKAPFVGEIKVVIEPEENSLLLIYRPKYFFQASGWIILDRMAQELQKRLASRAV